MKISFIIPLFNEMQTIGLCLNAILKEKTENDEIIVVDNGSTDDSTNIVERYSQALLIKRPGITISGVRNAGAAYARGDLLAFIDADCILCEGWRDNILEAFKCPSISATGAKYDIPNNARWIEKAWFSQRRSNPGKTNYINSGNFVIKKNVFYAVGGFDEKLITGEDSALCLSLNQAGFLVFEKPDARVIHLGNPKNIYKFYQQQKWHGMGMLATFKKSLIDKPFIMTIAFLLCFFSAFGWLFTGFIDGRTHFLEAVGLILFIPFLTALYRVLCYRNFSYFPQLTLLYLVYFSARVNALFTIIFFRHE